MLDKFFTITDSTPTDTEKKGRKAWRDLLITTVGSGAFFAAALGNVIKTYRKHGWPENAFKTSDYILMTIPFIVVGIALHEEMNGE